MRTHSALFAATTVVLMGVVVACSSSDSGSTVPEAEAACQPGDTPECTCADGTKSVAQCVNGKASTCACKTDAVVDAAPPPGDSGLHEGGPTTSDAGSGSYLGPCNDTTDCPAGDICFQFGSKGKLCTKECTDSTQCPAPSPKCNPKKVCAAPD